MWPAVPSGVAVYCMMCCHAVQHISTRTLTLLLKMVMADDMWLVLQLLIGASTLLRYHPIMTALQMQTL